MNENLYGEAAEIAGGDFPLPQTQAPGGTPSAQSLDRPERAFIPTYYNTPAPPAPPRAEQPRPSIPGARPARRKKSRRGAFAAAVLLASVALSAVFGLGGAYVGSLYFAPKAVTSPDGAVFYQSVPQGDAKTTQTAAGSTGLDIAAVAAGTLDTVVAISTEAVTGNGRFAQMVTKGAGSGVILSADGYIVTNCHVIDGARKITVRLQNGSEHSAELIGADEKTDLAMLKIEAEGLSPAVMGSSGGLSVGEPAVAIGNPLGELGGTVTEGIISALDREVTIDGQTMTLLQTSAAINPGNSGGGLFSSRGELIGIVNAKSSGTGIEGLGFAIPIDTARPVITDLTEHGYVSGRVEEPFALVEVGDYIAAMQYRVSEPGLYISQSADDQFKRGDMIASVDGADIATEAGFSAALAGKVPGDRLKITVLREGEEMTFTLTLQEAR